MGELWNAGELCTRVSRKDSVARQRAASGVGAPPGQGGVQCPVLGHSSLDKTIWLLLTLSSVFWGRWENELQSYPTLAREHLMITGSDPYQHD